MTSNTAFTAPYPKDYRASCGDFKDFTEFTDYIVALRKLDDFVIFNLNKTDGSIPQCNIVWEQYMKNFQNRDRLINNCIKELQSQETEDPKKFAVKKQLSFLKSELDVDKILQSNVENQFRSKCKGFHAK